MKKRVFASLLTLCLALSLLPTGVFAYVGPIRTTTSEMKEVHTFTLTNGGVTYQCLQNDYITFAVQASGSGSSLRSYTVPTGQLNGHNSNIFNFPAETNRFSVSEGETENVGGARSMNITSISGSTDSSSGYTTVTVMLGFSDSRLEGGLTFYLERVNRGGGEGTIEDSDTIPVDPNESGSHWAVASTTSFALTEAGKSQLGSDGRIYPYHIKEYPLSTMGHQSSGGAPLLLGVASEMWEQYGGMSFSTFEYVDYYTRNIATGLSRTSTDWRNEFAEYDYTRNYYTEAYTTNYASANPFVGLSSFYYNDSAGVEGVEGHGYAFYPEQVESNGSSLTTYGYDPNDPLGAGLDMESCFFSSIWGFRDLFSSGDGAAPSNPDAVAVSGDTLYVTVSGGSVSVSPAYSGSVVATIRGEFSGNGFAQNDLKHTTGVLSMARAMHPDSAGSQFFIMVAPAPHLDGQYAAFGQVTGNVEEAIRISEVPTDWNDKPKTPVVIQSIRVDTQGVDYPEPEKR